MVRRKHKSRAGSITFKIYCDFSGSRSQQTDGFLHTPNSFGFSAWEKVKTRDSEKFIFFNVVEGSYLSSRGFLPGRIKLLRKLLDRYVSLKPKYFVAHLYTLYLVWPFVQQDLRLYLY